MAILSEPLYSEEARGQVAKTAVFKRGVFHPIYCAYSYHKINWTRPKVAQAWVWKNLCNQWRALSPAEQDFWKRMAPGVLTGFNLFMKHAGAYPYPPCYEPPAGNSLLFNFIETDYDPPETPDIPFYYDTCV